MRPSKSLLVIAGLWLAGAVALFFLRLLDLPSMWLQWSWEWGGIALVVVAAIDALRPGLLRQISLRRELPGSLALGVATPARLEITNPLSRTLSLEVGEAPSPALQFSGLPARVILPSNTQQTIHNQLTAVQRGDTELDRVVARIDSRWRLWQFRIRLGEPIPLKVYPNFSPIAYFADIGMEQHLRQLGIHQQQARGEGLEFKQLREFIEGDSLRQVDWKASARRRKPISREYQDERDQELFFLVDCGRRLRHRDGESLSHFDHALNAVLLTAYIASRQGDAVGLFSFAGDERWLNPVKGNAATNILLNTVYDLQTSSINSDFIQVAEHFAARRRKRALVVIVSNIRDEDCSDLLAATRILSKQHVVVVASLREALIDELLQKPVRGFEEALDYASMHHYFAQRQSVIKQLTASGVTVVDSLPEKLHIQLANEYLRLKRMHRI